MNNSILRLLILWCLAVTGGAWSATAQPVQHLTTVQAGGMPGVPVMGGISRLTNGVQLNWSGPAGYYQVFQKSNGLTAPWIALGKATNVAGTATINQLYSNAFFRVAGPAPNYAGAKLCLACHLAVCQYETNTAHASAFSSPAFAALGGQTNASCLPCHTVGYGLATGFVSAKATPLLAGVQCENCHGPAANHAGSPDNPIIRPRVEVAATLCGGCHRASHTSFANPPTYEEWSASGHGAVVPDALKAMTAASASIDTCGACHSGSARLALLAGTDPALKLTNDCNVAIGCAVCHNPHATNAVSPVQLRNPLFSTNDFQLVSADTASVGAFTNKYNANTNINLCAQCHNARGAAWTDTARAPHHSGQYNILIGSVGTPALDYPFNPGTHAGLPAANGGFYLTNQCVECHMSAEPAASSGAHNHSLAVNYNVCANCHVGQTGQQAQAGLAAFLTPLVTETLQSLNRWAATRAPVALITNGVVAWEYTTPGGVTWQTNATGGVTGWSLNGTVNFTGPNAAGQALIPNNIKQARYDLYLFLNDGSMGAHNPFYALALLEDALSLASQ